MVSFTTLNERITVLAFAGFRSIEADIPNPARVIETAKADAAPVEGLVRGPHDGLLHVVDINLDLARNMFANEANPVPVLGAPLVSLGSFMGNLDPGLVVHNKTIVGVRVGHAGNMRVVEVGAILKTVEDAHIPMAVFLARLLKLGLEHEVLHLHVPNQANGQGGAYLVLVLAWFGLELDKALSSHSGHFPIARGGEPKTFFLLRLITLKILGVHQLVAGRNAFGQ